VPLFFSCDSVGMGGLRRPLFPFFSFLLFSSLFSSLLSSFFCLLFCLLSSVFARGRVGGLMSEPYDLRTSANESSSGFFRLSEPYDLRAVCPSESSSGFVWGGWVGWRVSLRVVDE